MFSHIHFFVIVLKALGSSTFLILIGSKSRFLCLSEWSSYFSENAIPTIQHVSDKPIWSHLSHEPLCSFLCGWHRLAHPTYSKSSLIKFYIFYNFFDKPDEKSIYLCFGFRIKVCRSLYQLYVVNGAVLVLKFQSNKRFSDCFIKIPRATKSAI